MDKSENLDAVRFEAVRNYEAGAIQERRAKFGIKDKRGAGHLGIAHSGGGIRSATFSLGILQYLAESKRLLGSLPTQQTIVAERFFDEAGGMQLVIHSPFGSRVNRAWGLALRKRSQAIERAQGAS